jgi:hypothetical protein
VTETDQISKPNREVKVKRSCHRRGRCFALFGGFLVGPQLQVKQLSHAFLFVYKLTAGRVKQKLYKMKKVMFTAFAVGLGLTANVMAQVPSYVPTNGLVGWWPFNGNANDESGNGNNGTVNGATLTTDRFGNVGKAYSFDGSDWIELNLLPAIDNSNEMAVSVWVKSSGLNSNTNCGVGCAQSYFCRGYDGSNGFYIYTSQSTSPNFYSSVNGPFNGGVASSSTVVNMIPHTQWHHLLMNYDGINVEFYEDGNLVGTTPYTNNVGVNSASVKAAFGRQFVPNYPYYTVGSIDDGAIWNRALTDQEISDLYNANICYDYVTVTDTLVINTGITGYNPITYLNTLKIWPNPSNDHITIDAGNLATMNGYSIKIEDAQGQQVFQNAVNQQQFYVDITTWGGNGLYFVRIIDPQGNTVDIKKIVLQ